MKINKKDFTPTAKDGFKWLTEVEPLKRKTITEGVERNLQAMKEQTEENASFVDTIGYKLLELSKNSWFILLECCFEPLGAIENTRFKVFQYLDKYTQNYDNNIACAVEYLLTFDFVKIASYKYISTDWQNIVDNNARQINKLMSCHQDRTDVDNDRIILISILLYLKWVDSLNL